MIDLKPFTDDEIAYKKCPHCGVEATGEYLFDDGDTIPGLWHKLSEAQKQPTGFDYTLMVGQQRCCNKPYYGILATFIDADVPQEYLIQLAVKDTKCYHAKYTGSNPAIPKTWLVERLLTEYGPAYVHTFGLFRLAAGELVGPTGVSCCRPSPVWGHASEILYTLWDDLRAIKA